MKLMILGEARHGKDTVCDILHVNYGWKFVSSSYFVAERAVRPWLAARGIKYPDFDTMYADRVNWRPQWFTAIAEYNTPDPARLGRELYAEYDMYCGIRNRDELLALQKLGIIDATIWVDASKRCPREDVSSCTVTPDMADYILDNNGPLDALPEKLHWLMTQIKPKT